MAEKLNVSLSVVQWNVILEHIRPLDMAETTEIFNEIAKQAEGNTAKGLESVTIVLNETQIGKILNVIQFAPYREVAQIVYELFKILDTVKKTETKPEATEEKK